jgi:hypothetical protein
MMAMRAALLLAGALSTALHPPAAPPVECRPFVGEQRWIPQFHGLPELRLMPNSSGGSGSGVWWPGEMNDANTILEHEGVYHMMFQTDCVKADAAPGGLCAGGKVGSHAFSHLVSTDGVRWRRLIDAISGTPGSPYDGADGDCDGTVSFPDGIGPVLLYGADCGRGGRWPPGPVPPPPPSPPGPPSPPSPPAPPVPPPSKTCEYTSETDYKDGGIGANTWIPTAEACCAHCAATNGCAVAVFVHNPPCANGTAPADCGQCYMKSSASQPYSKPGAVSCRPKNQSQDQLATSFAPQDYPRVAVALGNASDPLLQHWSKTAKNPIAWADPAEPASFPGRVWRSSSPTAPTTNTTNTAESSAGGGGSEWSMVGVSGESGPMYRYTTKDPTLHGPWVVADRAFATTSSGMALSAGSNPDFYSLPGPTAGTAGTAGAGEPTHLVNAGKGGGFRLCVYDGAAQALRNCTEVR